MFAQRACAAKNSVAAVRSRRQHLGWICGVPPCAPPAVWHHAHFFGFVRLQARVLHALPCAAPVAAARPPALQYMTECTFNWRVVKNICTECHVYDEKTAYKPFDYKEEEALFAFQRKVLPDTV